VGPESGVDAAVKRKILPLIQSRRIQFSIRIFSVFFSILVLFLKILKQVDSFKCLVPPSHVGAYECMPLVMIFVFRPS
jgi:hypothetical protein